LFIQTWKENRTHNLKGNLFIEIKRKEGNSQ
jgi:hypothetical protein